MNTAALPRSAMRNNSRRISQTDVQARRISLLRWSSRVSAAAAMLLLLAGTAMLLNEQFRLESWRIEIEGDNRTALQQQVDREMRSLSDLDYWHTRPAILSDRLLAMLPDLLDVHVQRSLSGTATIEARARTAVALWQHDQSVELVDLFGTAYRQLQPKEISDLPILRADENELFAASQLLGMFKATHPRRFQTISELLTGHDEWKINFSKGEQWILSRHQDVSDSIRSVSDLLDKPRWKSGHWRVDARSESRWFIRPATQEGVI